MRGQNFYGNRQTAKDETTYRDVAQAFLFLVSYHLYACFSWDAPVMIKDGALIKLRSYSVEGAAPPPVKCGVHSKQVKQTTYHGSIGLNRFYWYGSTAQNGPLVIVNHLN